MKIREISATNPNFIDILINGKNVGTRNNVIAVVYEKYGTAEEILYVKEAYSSGGFIVAVKQNSDEEM